MTVFTRRFAPRSIRLGLKAHFLAPAVLVSLLAGCGEEPVLPSVASIAGTWEGTAEPTASHSGMEMSITFEQGADGALTGEGDVRLLGGGGARAEVITISSGIHRPPEASFVLTNAVIFTGTVDANEPSIHFRIVPTPDRPYAPEITLRPQR